MPFNTYNNPTQALKNCKKVMKITKCDGVKLEGGLKIIKIVKLLIKNKIPVMGHLGIMPQFTKGKFKSKGKSVKEKKEITRDSKLLEDAGAFSIVLECVEKNLAAGYNYHKKYMRNCVLCIKPVQGTSEVDFKPSLAS